MKDNRLNIGFLGGRILGYRCLKELNKFKDNINVKFVIGHKIDGEKNSDWNPPLLPLAKKLGFKTLMPKTLKDPDVISFIRSCNPDLLVNPFCNRIIPKEILDIPRLGTINFHYGKLPEYRGRFIVTHLILNGEKSTHVTAHFMDEGIDTGDIIFEKQVKILPNDTARTLYFRCTETALLLFEKVLNYAISKKPFPKFKQIGKVNYFAHKEPNDGMVYLSWDQKTIEKFIRAMTFPPISKPLIQIGNLKFEININE